MPCPGCHTSSGSSAVFICPHCLNKLLKLYKTQRAAHTSSLLPSAISRAKVGLEAVSTARQHEAGYRSAQQRVLRLQREIQRLQSLSESESDEIEARKRALAQRRDRLKQARAALEEAEHPHNRSKEALAAARVHGSRAASASTTTTTTDSVRLHELNRLVTQELAQTRMVLVGEILAALNVTPSRAADCTYDIGFLPAPRLAKMTGLPKGQLNALLLLLTHLVRLASFYLGIRLPFIISSSPLKPLIRAADGNSNATRYSKPMPLYLSSGQSGSRKEASSPLTTSKTEVGLHDSSLGSTPVQQASAASHAQALTLALHMLAYDAAFMHRALSSDGSNGTARASDEGRLPEYHDVLGTLVAALSSSNVERFTSAATETYKSTEWPALDFTTFRRILETAPATDDNTVPGPQRSPAAQIDSGGLARKRHTAGLSAASRVLPERPALSSPNSPNVSDSPFGDPDKDDEWDVL